MRILGLVCYFLVLFYGVEPVAEEFSNDSVSKTLTVKMDKQQDTTKASINISTVCTYNNSKLIE